MSRQRYPEEFKNLPAPIQALDACFVLPLGIQRMQLWAIQLMNRSAYKVLMNGWLRLLTLFRRSETWRLPGKLVALLGRQ